MEKKIKELIKNLKRQGFSAAVSGECYPDEKVNVWFVIAKLEEILLEQKAE